MLIPVFACGYSSLLCWFQLRANYKTLEHTLYPKAWQGQLLPTQQQPPRTRVHAFNIANCCLSTFFFIMAITTNCRGSTDGGKQTTTGLFNPFILDMNSFPNEFGRAIPRFSQLGCLLESPTPVIATLTSLPVNNLQTSNQIAIGTQDLNLELFCSKLDKAINQTAVLGKALELIYCSSWCGKYNTLTKDIKSKIDQMLQREGL